LVGSSNTTQPPAVNVNWCIQAKKTNNSSGSSSGTGSDCDCPDKDTIKRWIDEKIKNINGGLSIGTVFSHVSKTPPTGAVLLSGQTLAKSDYTEFYNYIKDNKDNIRVISNDDYEAEITKYDFCGAFVISDNEVRLPTLNGYIPLGNNVPVVGNGIALGLTDGTNLNGLATNPSVGATYRNEIYGSNVGTKTDASGTFSGNVAIGVTTNADNSGLIVDTSGYPKDGLYWYIQVYNGTYTSTNVDSKFDFVIESYHDDETGSWYRKYKSGWVEQGGVVASNTYGNQDTVTVVLPIEMKNSIYHVGATVKSTAADAILVWMVDSQTETTVVFKADIFWSEVNNTKANERGLIWKVSGYSAPGSANNKEN
jgi:hypothetical protein